MNFEKNVEADWRRAVFDATEDIEKALESVKIGLDSNNPNVRCAAIAVLTEANQIESKNLVLRKLNDDSEEVQKFALEYLGDFAETGDSRNVLNFIEKYPFLSSNCLSKLFPKNAKIIQDDDTLEEIRKGKLFWTKVVTSESN